MQTLFDGFDATLLARFQFAFTVAFHFIFPAFSIGLASYLAVLPDLDSHLPPGIISWFHGLPPPRRDGI